MEDRQSSDSGSFTTGFTLGIFAGALGYFLFGTKDGNSMRQKIAREWEQAKEKLIEEDGLETSVVTLRDLALNAKKHVLDVLDGMASEQRAPRASARRDATSKEDVKSAKSPRKKKQLFKGV